MGIIPFQTNNKALQQNLSLCFCFCVQWVFRLSAHPSLTAACVWQVCQQRPRSGFAVLLASAAAAPVQQSPAQTGSLFWCGEEETHAISASSPCVVPLSLDISSCSSFFFPSSLPTNKAKTSHLPPALWDSRESSPFSYILLYQYILHPKLFGLLFCDNRIDLTVYCSVLEMKEETAFYSKNRILYPIIRWKQVLLAYDNTLIYLVLMGNKPSHPTTTHSSFLSSQDNKVLSHYKGKTGWKQ